ncbi:hypothetical protein Ahy_B08g092428 isoform G [Arachis hypogaea]|uniref:Uncharacterized protein n=1 Tax=Arachis hypogaea TaxID=3818 RepID=A0A444Y3W0_ARAHY|nr:hypothetical protein Ahy_B08g092428 isoform G [Arachis hypogaea]
MDLKTGPNRSVQPE